MKIFKGLAISLCAILCTGQVMATKKEPNLVAVPPKINADTYILIDANSGQELTSHNPHYRHHPASLTKMMTSYVVAAAIKQNRVSNEDLVSISENAWAKNFKGSSVMFLEVGKRVPLYDIQRGIIISSGNDASVAAAEHIAGNTDAFVDLMNQYVKFFGLKNTHFTTVHGLDDPNQYSTAYDLAIIAKHLIQDMPEEYVIYREKEFFFNNIRQSNRNKLLWSKDLNVDGVKTGHTDGAGYNLVSSATQDGMRLIAVVLGTPSARARVEESHKLLKWGFANFENKKVLNKDQIVAKTSVYYGEDKSVGVGVDKDYYLTFNKGQEKKVKSKIYWHQENLQAPLTKGQLVGEIVYFDNNKEIARIPLKVMKNVNASGYFGRMFDSIILTVKGWFS